MRTQRTTEMEPSRIIWAEEPMMLDCLDPIRYQLPVWRNGFFCSSDSSLKLMAVASVFFRVPLLSKIRNIYFRAVPVCWNASERERERERERETERRVIVIIKKTKEVIIEGTKTKVWGCWCVTSGKWNRQIIKMVMTDLILGLIHIFLFFFCFWALQLCERDVTISTTLEFIHSLL